MNPLPLPYEHEVTLPLPLVFHRYHNFTDTFDTDIKFNIDTNTHFDTDTLHTASFRFISTGCSEITPDLLLLVAGGDMFEETLGNSANSVGEDSGEDKEIVAILVT